MASNITPSFDDSGDTFPAATTVAHTAVARATKDLTAKFGAYLNLQVGWLGSTAPATAAPTIRIRRLLNAGATESIGDTATRLTTATVGTTFGSTTLSANSAVGATTLSFTAVTNFAAGDVIYIGGNSGTPSNEEFARISSISGTTVTVDAPLKLSHVSTDTVVNKADCYAPIWLPGGSQYEMIMDHGPNATGSSIRVIGTLVNYVKDVAS